MEGPTSGEIKARANEGSINVLWMMIVVFMVGEAATNLVWILMFSAYREDIRQLEKRIEDCCGQQGHAAPTANGNVLNIESSRNGLTREVLKSWGVLSDAELRRTSGCSGCPAGDDGRPHG